MNDAMTDRSEAEDQHTLHWLDLLLIVVLCGAFMFFRLGRYVPLSAPEAIVGVTATEAIDGHWIVPHFNGDVHLQQFPLMYWAVGFFGLLFGQVSEFVVRLPSALSATATALLMAVLAARMFGRLSGVVVGLAMAGTAGMLWQSHHGSADMMTTALIVSAFVCAWLGLDRLRAKQNPWTWFIIAYAALALAMLASLPGVAIVFLVPIMAFTAWASKHWHDRSLIFKLHLHWGVVIVGVIVGAYVVAASRTVPINDVLTLSMATHATRDDRPMWFYLPQLFVLALPWSVFLPVGLVLPFRKAHADRHDELIYLFFWLVAGLAIFTALPGKRAYYILPIIPPAVVLSVAGFNAVLEKWRSVRKVSMVATVGVIASSAIFIAGHFILRRWYPLAMTRYSMLAAIVLIAQVLGSWAYVRWGGLALATTISLASGLCFAAIWPAIPLMTDSARDPRWAAQLITKRIGADADIRLVGQVDAPLIYYYGRPIPVIDKLNTSDLKTDAIRYFVSDQHRYADLRQLEGLYEVLTISRYFGEDRPLVLYSNTSPVTTHPVSTATLETP